MIKEKSKNNRTITINRQDKKILKERIIKKMDQVKILENIIINSDFFKVIEYFPKKIIDLAIIDPLYNIDKNFNTIKFKEMTAADYYKYTERWVQLIIPLLKDTSSIYVCCDWKSSPYIYNVLTNYLICQNRITWEREKGRGSEKNWKNCLEDIWFFTVSNKYTFNAKPVKLLKKVNAPYRDKNGEEKDWFEKDGVQYRLTHSSNMWTDITIPFWSMPENTDHPTQKPEKLFAKLILASSNENDLIFDPFSGSGTASVAAKKLNRKYIGIEIDEVYCLLAEKRLEIANTQKEIQGIENGIFLERNTILGGNSKKIEGGILQV